MRTRQSVPWAPPCAAGLLVAVLASAPAFAALRQTPAPQPTPAAETPAVPAAPTAVVQDDAETTRLRLHELLRQLPPPVVQALRSDASLLLNESYLAPYPALSAFLAAHPEVARNPQFFVGMAVIRQRSSDQAAIELFENVLGGLAGLAALSIVVGLLAWLVRTVIDHRRWLRLSRVQAEVHTKLLDRLTSNDDLLAYIQTSPGRRFLESAPIPLDAEPRAASAPLTRILWSLQSGVVLGALGVGLYSAQRQVPSEVAQGMVVMGTIVLSLGVGFVLAAVVAYAVSARAGLMPAPRPAGHE